MSADLGPLLALGALVVAILAGASADASVAEVALVVGAAGLAAAAFTRPRTRVVLAVCAIAALGVGVSARATDGARATPLADALHGHAAVTVRGTVTSDPSRRELRHERARTGRPPRWPAPHGARTCNGR